MVSTAQPKLGNTGQGGLKILGELRYHGRASLRQLRSKACRNTVDHVEDFEPPLRLPRVDRWLAKRGGGLPVLTIDGAVLLDRRLRVRRRAAAIGFSVGALAVAAFSACTGLANGSAVSWYAIGAVLAAVAALTWAVLVRVGERQLAATVTRRVGRDTAMPVWRQFGVLRSINCGIVVLAGWVVLAGLIAVHARSGLITLFGGLLVAVTTLSGFALWQLVHAPALAADDGSLAADQRLRRQSVYYAVYPLVVLVVATTSLIEPSGVPNRLDRPAEWFWGWGLLLPVVFIEAIARDLEKGHPFWRPRRRTWKQLGPYA